MSYGWSRHGKAAVLRGPLVSGLVTQLATNTAWGSLDVLLIDMPPGTGDIHITVR
jgi:ATP-binding protein involved in chromosome partitioning